MQIIYLRVLHSLYFEFHNTIFMRSQFLNLNDRSCYIADKFGGLCNKRTIYNGWGYKPTPGTCDQFYQCDEEGVSHQQSCAAGTFYDGNECRHAEKVHCSYGIIDLTLFRDENIFNFISRP